MSALDALDLARRHGVIVEARGDRLHLRAPAKPPGEVLDILRRNKAEIMAALSAPGPLDDERASGVESDGDVPAAWCAGFARLDHNLPPGDVPYKRWRRYIDDVAGFLDDGWAARAVALGWEPLDLFGCDQSRPYARIDRAGLLWLLNGGKIVALSTDSGVIETATGARHTFRARPGSPGRVLPWGVGGKASRREG